MKPIISPWIVYLINTISNFEILLLILLLILVCAVIIISVFLIICYNECDIENEDKDLFTKIKKHLKISLIWLVITSLIYVTLPSKDTMYTMLVLENVTSDNIQAIGKTGKDVVDYITDKIDKIINNEKENQ